MFVVESVPPELATPISIAVNIQMIYCEMPDSLNVVYAKPGSVVTSLSYKYFTMWSDQRTSINIEH